MNKKQRSLENAFWKANKIGDSVNLFDVLTDYETIRRNADDQEIEAMYNYLADRLGFSTKPLLTIDQLNTLEDNGWYPPTW